MSRRHYQFKKEMALKMDQPTRATAADWWRRRRPGARAPRPAAPPAPHQTFLERCRFDTITEITHDTSFSRPLGFLLDLQILL
ncbi:hypothetical protein EVAR_39131_1 [Eumeta japonica]|uniref:Uncharacterized protein n=1 Tax=Eumeta variegata TaxID=151549 RepID=A0A4C1X9Y9_EUMVA|nr:hypothetical protein EVAR_39131_1 [Eumeta japonica]